MSIFNGLYDEYRHNQINADQFLEKLSTLCSEDRAREIIELVKLNCPIDYYPELEEALQNTATHEEAMERENYERNLHQQYQTMSKELDEIKQVATDHAKGLNHDCNLYKALKRIQHEARGIKHTIRIIQKDEECGCTVNRVDEFKTAVEVLSVQLQDKIKECDYLEDDYDPLLDDDSLSKMKQGAHDWVINKIKHIKHGVLMKKRFTIQPRSQKCLIYPCSKEDYFLCYWNEKNHSRLLFSCTYEGKEDVEIVPQLIRISQYCFLFHSDHAGSLTLEWSNKLSFRKKKQIISYVRKLHGDPGKEVFTAYDKLQYDILDVQSKFLAKHSLEGGVVCIKATTTSQQADGIHYICTCYWKHLTNDAHACWEVSRPWEDWKDLHEYIEYAYPEMQEELPPFPKEHFLMTPLLVEDRLLCLNRYIQGLVRLPTLMRCYEVNHFFELSTHIRRVIRNVLLMMKSKTEEGLSAEKTVETSEVTNFISSHDELISDPISYLSMS